jgi:regulator of RNase E activity RraB
MLIVRIFIQTYFVLKAVLTGDIVNSMALESHLLDQLLAEIKDILQAHKHEFFRGDSFQAYFDDPRLAVRAALLCRTAAIRFSTEQVQVDARIAIGLGAVELPVQELATARGEAFLLSGRTLDGMGKSGGRVFLVTEDALIGLTLELLSDHLNSMLKRLTQKQAEVIHELLLGLTQQQVSEKLGRSKSTISQHVNAADWDALDKALNDYNRLIDLIGTN